MVVLSGELETSAEGGGERGSVVVVGSQEVGLSPGGRCAEQQHAREGECMCRRVIRARTRQVTAFGPLSRSLDAGLGRTRALMYLRRLRTRRGSRAMSGSNRTYFATDVQGFIDPRVRREANLVSSTRLCYSCIFEVLQNVKDWLYTRRRIRKVSDLSTPSRRKRSVRSSTHCGVS